MAYKDKNGNTRYSKKEKMEYHTKCCNSGKDAKGKALSQTQRVRHAILAERYRNSINGYYNRQILANAKRGK